MTNRTIGLLTLLTAAIVVSPQPAAAAPSAPSAPSPWETALASTVVIQTNAYRSEAGCEPLAVDPMLVEASARQSGYLAAGGRFGHEGPGGSTYRTRARAAGYTDPVGENLAWGHPTATAVMDAWMASPPHRANILDCR